MSEMRKFETGATRNSIDGKNQYVLYFSPLVKAVRGHYMTKHRIQADGTIRKGDNWKQRFGNTPQEHYDCCIDSHDRHAMDWWLEHDNYRSRENDGNNKLYSLIDAVCGDMQNGEFYLHVLIEEAIKENPDFLKEYLGE